MQEIDPVSQAMHGYVRLCSHLVCILLVIISCTICNHYTQTLHATFDNDSSNKQYTFDRRQCTVIGELQSFDLDYVMYMYICPLFFAGSVRPTLHHVDHDSASVLVFLHLSLLTLLVLYQRWCVVILL